MRTYFAVLLFFLAGFTAIDGQDPLFTQFYAAPLYLSPSFAGGNGESRIILNFRDQWPKLPGDYVTFSLSADHYLDKFNSGVGLLLLRDQAAGGLISMTNVGLNYNYNLNISKKWRLTPGLQVYYHTKYIDYNKLVFSDQISRDLILPSSLESDRLNTIQPIRHLDVTSSLLAYNDYLWAGFTLDHMLSLNSYMREENGYLPLRLSVFGGGKYIISGRRRSQTQESISAAFNFFSQDIYRYLDLGAYYSRTPMLFGLWYRGIPIFPDNPNNGALALLFGYNLGSVKLYYSYDYTVSRLMTKTGGAHEISLSFNMQPMKVKNKKKRRMIPCPTL
jgi:type IX secretion system PorP/SprF family membrane protein